MTAASSKPSDFQLWQAKVIYYLGREELDFPVFDVEDATWIAGYQARLSPHGTATQLLIRYRLAKARLACCCGQPSLS